MAKSDKITTHTITSNGPKAKGYEVTVEGQYYSNGPNKPLKFYSKEKFIFPEIITFVDGKKQIERIVNSTAKSVWVPNVRRANALQVCLGQIKNFLIEDRLKEKYADFVSVRTINIFSKEEINIEAAKYQDVTTKAIKDMTKSELSQTIAIQDLNIVLSNYADLGDMKNAVKQAIQQKNTDDIAAGKTEEMSEDEKLLLEPDQSSLFG
ncbi:MAG: hypothetical protein V3V88_02100 [Dehalococcoidia bacterium]